jgi:putative membrane protein
VAEIPIQRKEGRNIWPMLIGLLLLAAILWYVFSRRNNTTDTAAARADSTAVATNGAVTTDSAGGTMANTGAMGAGAAGAAGTASGSGMNSGAGTSGTMSDADIAGVIHEVNAGEIAAGKMAQTKASNSDVKAFARDMVREHQSLDQKSAKLAVGNTATGNTSGNANAGNTGGARDSVVNANKTMSSQLESAGSGAAFDRAYLDGQITAHQNTLAFLQRVQNQAQGSDLKQIVTQAIPDVEKHLARARTLQSKVGQ